LSPAAKGLAAPDASGVLGNGGAGDDSSASRKVWQVPGSTPAPRSAPRPNPAPIAAKPLVAPKPNPPARDVRKPGTPKASTSPTPKNVATANARGRPSPAAAKPATVAVEDHDVIAPAPDTNVERNGSAITPQVASKKQLVKSKPAVAPWWDFAGKSLLFWVFLAAGVLVGLVAVAILLWLFA